MKKGLEFLMGVIVGIIVGIIITYASFNMDSENRVRNCPITWYEEPYETIIFHDGVYVFQMLQDNYGLSRPKSFFEDKNTYLVHEEKIYDGKHIAKNKFYIKGVYTYTNTKNRVCNVAVIEPVN